MGRFVGVDDDLVSEEHRRKSNGAAGVRLRVDPAGGKESPKTNVEAMRERRSMILMTPKMNEPPASSNRMPLYSSDEML